MCLQGTYLFGVEVVYYVQEDASPCKIVSASRFQCKFSSKQNIDHNVPYRLHIKKHIISPVQSHQKELKQKRCNRIGGWGGDGQ